MIDEQNVTIINSDTVETVELPENVIVIGEYTKTLTVPVGRKGRKFSADLLTVLSKLQSNEGDSQMQQMLNIASLWKGDDFENEVLPMVFGFTTPTEMNYLESNLTLGECLEPFMKAVGYYSKVSLGKREVQEALKK